MSSLISKKFSNLLQEGDVHDRVENFSGPFKASAFQQLCKQENVIN